MKSLVRNSLGGLMIMGAATLAGIIHNSMRNQPMTLIPRVQASPAGAANSAAGGPGVADSSSTSPVLAEGLISIEGVKQSLSDPAVYIIDARADVAYNEGHIAGAMNVPYDRFTAFYDFLLASVPLDATVICYCWSPTCDFSDQLAQELRIMGYTNVLIFREGWEAWQAAGYPSET